MKGNIFLVYYATLSRRVFYYECEKHETGYLHTSYLNSSGNLIFPLL